MAFARAREIVGDDAIVGLRTRELELPREALVNVIVREGEALLPRGSTRLPTLRLAKVLSMSLSRPPIFCSTR